MVGFNWQCHLKWSLTSISSEIPLTMSPKWSLTSIFGGITMTMSREWSLTSISGGIPPTMSPQMILDLHIWWDSTDNVTSNDLWPPFLVVFNWQCHLNDHWPPCLVVFHWQCRLKWSLTSISGGIPLTMSSNDPWPPYLVGFHWQCILKWSLTSVSGEIPLTMSPQMILDFHILWDCTDNAT